MCLLFLLCTLLRKSQLSKGRWWHHCGCIRRQKPSCRHCIFGSRPFEVQTIAQHPLQVRWVCGIDIGKGQSFVPPTRNRPLVRLSIARRPLVRISLQLIKAGWSHLVGGWVGRSCAEGHLQTHAGTGRKTWLSAVTMPLVGQGLRTLALSEQPLLHHLPPLQTQDLRKLAVFLLACCGSLRLIEAPVT